MRTPSYQNILPLDYKLQMKKSSPNAHKKVIEIDFSFQIWTLSLNLCLFVFLFLSFSLSKIEGSQNGSLSNTIQF